MKRIILTIPILTFMVISLNAQSDYYKSPQKIFYGIRLEDKGKENYHKCFVSQTNKTIALEPGEVIEYGFADGRVYRLENIPFYGLMEQGFALELVRGENSLLYYGGDPIRTFILILEDSSRYYIREEDSETGLNYKETLKQIFKNDSLALAASEKVRFSKKSMTDFIEGYNNGEIILKKNISLETGIGLELAQCNDSEILKYFENNLFNMGPSFYMHIEVPLMANYFMLITGLEANYQEYNSMLYQSLDNGFINNDYFLDRIQLRLPVKASFVKNYTKHSIFIEPGLFFSYMLVDKFQAYESVAADGVLNTTEIYPDFNPLRFYYGPSISTGFNIDINRGMQIVGRVDYILAYNKLNLLNVEGYNINVSLGLSYTLK